MEICGRKWPRELWWCESPDCDEPAVEDPCQHCGEAVKRYRVVPVSHQPAGAVDPAAERDRLRREIAYVLIYDLDEGHPAYARLYAALDEPSTDTGAVDRADDVEKSA